MQFCLTSFITYDVKTCDYETVLQYFGTVYFNVYPWAIKTANLTSYQSYLLKHFFQMQYQYSLIYLELGTCLSTGELKQKRSCMTISKNNYFIDVSIGTCI